MKSSTMCRLSVSMSRRRGFGASALAVFLILSGCSGAQETERTVDETPSEAVVSAEASRTPPPWTQPASLSPVDSCKVEDGQPSNTRGVMEGTQVNGVRVRSNVGFPVSEGTLPSRLRSGVNSGHKAHFATPFRWLMNGSMSR
jgi:hypothetical protein